MTEILLNLLIIFVAVFCLILLLRLLLSFLLNRAYKRYLKLKKFGKKILPGAPKKYPKEDEELLRSKQEIPRAHSAVKAELQAKKISNESGTYELMESPQREFDHQEINSTQIVDFVKPVGFWTSLVLGQKLTYLVQSAQILNKRGDKGFWASMIEAQERVAGRQHSRGR
jgi:hypothetical protein